MSSKDVDLKIVDAILSTGLLPKEARVDTVFHECVLELAGLPMYRLAAEPAHLRDCHRRVTEQSHKLACDNYATFIRTAECTKQIFEDFERVEKRVELLTSAIPDFIACCHQFGDKCRRSISVASANSVALKNHNQILEILEIPQLLEACIRNNYIDEALEMIAHTRKLERRHQNIAIVTSVAHESKLAAQKLLDQLFQQLGGHLQLPACLKIVGYLRRMDCLPDALLRMKFLQCRDNYLKNLLRSLSTSDPFFHATKYMEITRVNLFDIATQYRAVFNDEDIYLSSSSDSASSHQGMLFSSWLVMRVRNFMLSLAEDLEQIIQNSVDYSHTNKLTSSSSTSSQSVGSKLQSLLGQSMYFGLSLSRIGSDFRALLMPMFYQTIMKYVNMRLEEIPDSFLDCISSYKWTVNIENEEIGSIITVLQTADDLLKSQKSEEISPPSRLMNHPLLAMLFNQMVSILEDIRLCCPRVLKERIRKAFIETIEKLMNCLTKFYQEESSNFSPKEHQLFLTMLSMFLCSFLPHISLCLTALFATDNCDMTAETHALDVRTMSSHFRSVLPEAFFAETKEEMVLDEMIYAEEDREGTENTGDDDDRPEQTGDVTAIDPDDGIEEEGSADSVGTSDEGSEPCGGGHRRDTESPEEMIDGEAQGLEGSTDALAPPPDASQSERERESPVDSAAPGPRTDSRASTKPESLDEPLGTSGDTDGL